MKPQSEPIIEYHTVPPEITPARFSDYSIGIFPLLNSRNAVKKAIKKGSLFLDGNEASTGDWVYPDSRIEFISFTANSPVYNLILDKAYEDNHIAVVIKPAGIPVNGNRLKTAEKALPCSLAVSPENDALPRPIPVHRIDSQTSGLVLVAKTANAAKNLGLQFENRNIKKRYRTLLTGPLRDPGEINTPIENREALTLYQPVKVTGSLKYDYLTLADLFPSTGRTHQLRIHMASIGHPILGDSIYGSEGKILKGKGLFLSAVELSFTHPVSGKPLSVKVDQPSKFTTIANREERRYKMSLSSNK